GGTGQSCKHTAGWEYRARQIRRLPVALGVTARDVGQQLRQDQVADARADRPLPILLLTADKAWESAVITLHVHEVIVREGARNPVPCELIVATTLNRA